MRSVFAGGHCCGPGVDHDFQTSSARRAPQRLCEPRWRLHCFRYNSRLRICGEPPGRTLLAEVGTGKLLSDQAIHQKIYDFMRSPFDVLAYPQLQCSLCWRAAQALAAANLSKNSSSTSASRTAMFFHAFLKLVFGPAGQSACGRGPQSCCEVPKRHPPLRKSQANERDTNQFAG